MANKQIKQTKEGAGAGAGGKNNQNNSNKGDNKSIWLER